MSDITSILQKLRSGEDPQAVEELLKLVYEELHIVAKREMNRQNSGHSLQPTILVNDAWLRLFPGGQNPQFNDRAHFFNSAAIVMHRILVDHARRKNALKRGKKEEMSETKFAELVHPAPDDLILRINDVLEEIAKDDEDSAKLAKLRFFVGLSMKEAADALGISLRSAERDWAYFCASFRRRFGNELNF